MMNIRIKERKKKLARPNSCLNLEVRKGLLKKYVQLAGEAVVDAKYIMLKLVELVWIKKSTIEKLKKKPMEGIL